jgi:hypothetical protein
VKSRISGRYVLATALVLVLGVPAFAVAQSGTSLLGGKRNPSGNGEFRAETEIIAQNGTYGTRQSNKTSGDGGGAIYGCRSNPSNEPCIRANNLTDGHAFEFETGGKDAGSITVGDTTAAPFTTNAKGTVTNLSADALDGRDAADFDDAQTLDGKDSADFAASGDLLFAAVGGGGALQNGRGALSSSGTNGDYTVKFNRNVSACSFTATVVDGSATAAGVTRPAGATPDTVGVTTGDPAAAHPFNLQVIC